ncbi:HNH endonuclease signature motif containing protein [Algoriphagus halophytocola]|uniref:HNH endonuclease signature motif containing protein n=1 Tax=Algoriphagus halophytocola TaxID=2991499 RepID=UPI0022DDE078|nr:HNH endonuclease signature motif containing protein [Algoriphagus sp. TR-M9]WBL44252.1 HNH endonuclease signature motif containing protein [Algoriphagus sp. TR-M9]
MGISLKTHKILWAKSGSKCAFPECKKDLVVDESETDDPSVIGEEAHIIGRKNDGPRGKSELPIEERDRYDNLILLCSIHHKLIDDQERKYTVQLLHQYKIEHENWVKENLRIDKAKERVDIIYAGYIDKFIELAEVDNWKGWSSFVFGGGQPHIYHRNIRKLRELIEFTLSRVWPGRYPDLEKAFHNFKNVSNDFLTVFEKHAQFQTVSDDELTVEEKDEQMIWTEKFYRIREYDEERYHSLLRKFEYHCLLVEDLALEMTRAANYLFDMVRLYFFPTYRIEEGILLIEIGPFMDMSWKTIRNEYKPDERESLYPGLRQFMEIRESRNYFRGKGIDEDYFPKYY